jgi:hypothetical protein
MSVVPPRWRVWLKMAEDLGRARRVLEEGYACHKGAFTAFWSSP